MKKILISNAVFEVQDTVTHVTVDKNGKVKAFTKYPRETRGTFCSKLPSFVLGNVHWDGLPTVYTVEALLVDNNELAPVIKGGKLSEEDKQFIRNAISHYIAVNQGLIPSTDYVNELIRIMNHINSPVEF